MNDSATITGLIQEEVKRLKEQKEFATTAEKEESAIIAEIEKVTKKIGTLQEQIEELQTKKVSLVKRLLAIASDTPNNTYSVLKLIENLDLSNRTYDRLKKSGFNTVSDILNYPFEDFYRVQHLPIRILKEIVDKMHEIGYPEFGTADFKNKETSIAYLYLAKANYNKLVRKGLNTIGDLLSCPFEDIYQIIGQRDANATYSRRNLVRKMHEIGYPEFGTADFKNKETSIEYLDLHSYYDYEHLKEDGFNTIGDLLSCPFEYFYELEYSVATIRNLVRKMHEIGYPEFGTADFKNKETSIEYIGLDQYDYKYLKRSGINTIGDLLSCPFENLFDNKFDRIYREEIIKKMHEIGYPEFGIS
ncbi:hypothetical protein IIY59_00695 [Candidatus Saccharibacteria bacterium]|nr:hypothetical protein [Candidatus Saccharibacteria bacterium]